MIHQDCPQNWLKDTNCTCKKCIGQ